MADDNTISDQGSSPEDAKVIALLQQIHPGADPAMQQSFLNELKATGSDTEQAQAVVNKYISNVQPTASGPGTANVPPTPQIQTQLPSSYAGAGYNSSDLMKQFNPAQTQAAYAQQQQMYQASLPSRAIGGILAGGSGSGDVMTSNKNQWDAIDKQNMLQSIEKQKALQTQATEGLAAGTSLQNQNKTAGEYTASQGKSAQELAQAAQKTASGALTLKNQQDLNNPASPQTMLAKAILSDQITKDPSLASNPQLKTMLARNDITAQQLMGFMTPDVLNAYKTKVGIVQTQAETGKTNAEIPGVAAESQIKQGVANKIAPITNEVTPGVTTDSTTGLPIGTNNVGNLKDPKTGQFRTFNSQAEGYQALQADLLGKIKGGYDTVSTMISRYAPASDGNPTPQYIANVAKAAGVGPNDKLDPTNAAQMQAIASAIIKQEGNTKASAIVPQSKPMLKEMPGTNTAINVGGVSINASPATTGSQTGQAEDQNTTRKQITHYSTNISDPADKLLALTTGGASTGLGAKIPASWSNTQSDAAQKAINKIVAENAAMNGTAFNQADADTLFKAGPRVVADYVINMKAEQARRQAKLFEQQQWSSSHNGSLQDFDPSILSQYKPLYNPSTKKVALIQQGTDEWNNRVKSGQWVPSSTGYYMNQGK